MTGSRLAHYEILEELGRGGMGVVYKARDTHLDRFVGIKVLPAEAVANPERKRRFIQEAKAASALNHPNIVTIHDIASENGTDFIVMEYVGGKTLEELISRKGMRLQDALKYSVQVADALTAAHEAGIVHRDVKPGNVMVTEKGLVKVLDFGLAKLSEMEPPGADGPTQTLTAAGGAAGNRPHTEEGMILGTVSYMSPEQAEGRKVDARSDIFAFGSVLYEMVSGRQPFQGESRMSTLAAILNKEPTELGSEIPPELRKLISRCLRKDLGRRIQHMVDVKLALEDLKEESDSGTLMVEGGAAQPRVRRRSPVRFAAVAAGAIVLATAGWYWQAHSGAPTQEAAVTLVPLTSDQGSELFPSLSPDGKQVAYAWDGNSRDEYHIWVRLVAGGPALQVTRGPVRDVNPVWSPDGSQIAFLRLGEGVFVVSPLGGPERKLAATLQNSIYFSGLAWHPDGKSLAVIDRLSEKESPRLIALSTASGEKRLLVAAPVLSADISAPVFSPDGKHLAFVRWPTTSNGELMVMPAEGGEPKQLTRDSARISGVAWTADGRELIFSSTRDGSFRLWRISATESNPQAPKPVVGTASGAMHPAIAAGAPTRLAYAATVADRNIWAVDTTAVTGKLSPSRQLIASTLDDSSPQHSPDGRKIVFASHRSGFAEIWVSDGDGANPVQLTSFDGNYSGSPRWSPDGKRIAFDSLSKGNRDIYVVNADGGPVRRLITDASQEWRPSYSADGRWIYFGSDRSGDPQIWKAPADGGAAVQVTRQGGYEAFEAADGKVVYYTKARFRRELMSVPVAGGEETEVVQPVWTGFWAVRGNSVLFPDFSAPGDFAAPLKQWDATTRQVTQIGTLDGAIPFGAPGFCVSPDGRRILYLRADKDESDLMLVENFR